MTWTVLHTPEALADARAAAADYRQRTTPPLRPDNLRVLGQARLTSEWIARLARERERIVPLLRHTASQDGAAAAAACVALVSLGDESYADRLVRMLSDDSLRSLGESLNQLALSAELIKATPGLQPITVPIRRIADTPGHQTRFAALRAAFELGAPSDSEDVVDEILRGAAGAKHPDPWIAKALAAVVRRRGAEALSAARALLRPPLLNASNVLRAARAGVAIVPELEALRSSPPKKDIYGSALEALATLKVDVTQEALGALDDPEIFYRAGHALGIAREGTGDEDAIAALSLAAINAPYKGPIAAAIARIGGPLAIETLAGLWHQSDEYARTYAIWRVKGITVRSAIQRFVDAGVIDRMPDERQIADALDTDWWSEPKDARLVWSFVEASGRWVESLGVDRDDQSFARHPLLIEKLVAVTGGALAIDHISQVEDVAEDEDENASTVQFVSGNRVYRVATRAVGRNFDLSAVLAVLNQALSDQGRSERFVRIHIGDTAQFIFGDPDAIAAACEHLFIPIRDDDPSFYSKFRKKVGAFWREASGRGPGTSAPSGWIGFHIVARTTAGVDVPRVEIERACERVLGLHVASSDSATDTTSDTVPWTRVFEFESDPASRDRSLTLHIQKRPGWTEVALLPMTREHFTAHGASSLELLFESLCVMLDAHVARTVRPGGWALVTPGELAGHIDCVDWLQYFSPRFSSWVARLPQRRTSPPVRSLPNGATMLRLDIAPFEAAWRTTVDVARPLDITLRPLPEAVQTEVSDEQRLLDVLPPEPRQWKPAERAEMLAARELVLRAIETGITESLLFERFRRLYLQAGPESLLLDRIDTWLSHYGQDETVAALGAVARAHENHTAVAPFDDEALEGCVKLIAWGGDDMTLEKRALLLEHAIDISDLETARFVRAAWDRGFVAGLMMLTAALASNCSCDRCAELRRATS
jgi:hypothetical protein